MKRTLLVTFASGIFLSNFLSAQEVKQFPNILDIKAYPTIKSKTTGLFADQGAWFGFCLLPDTTNIIGFGGPWILAEKKWTSVSLANLVVEDEQSKSVFNFKKLPQTYYPGYLEANYSSDNIKLEESLFFGEQGIAYQTATIENTSKSKINLKLSWAGTAWQSIRNVDKNILAISYNDERRFTLFNSFLNSKVVINSASNTFKVANSEIITLKSGEKTTVWIAFYYTFTKTEYQFVTTKLPKTVDEVSLLKETSQKRWDGYLKSVLLDKRSEFDVIAVKSVMTLISNWRKAGLDLFHDGIIPSHAVTYFDGFWAWDSWKHAAAVSIFAPELAKSQIQAMFDYQDSLGMIPDCIYLDKAENNWRDSKPPLAAWAVYETFKNCHDVDFVKSILPNLLRYHEWWYKYRDYNKNGWCEYGSTDGTLEAAAWESGMDNAVRYDSVKMLHAGGVAWSMDQESVDLNAYLLAEKHYLSELLKITGDVLESQKYEKDYKRLSIKFDDYFFDSSKGYYYDVSIATGKKIEVEGIEAFIPLWAKVASINSAKGVKDIIMNPKKFNTYMPCPTLTADHPKFDVKGYWRGPVWLDQAWFGVAGLSNYKFTIEAKELTLKLFKNANGLLSDKPIHENYNPLTGERLKAPHFSWSAAHYLMLYRMGYHLK